MENTLFLKIEIFTVIVTLFYILYFLWEKVFLFLLKIKNKYFHKRILPEKKFINEIDLKNKNKDKKDNTVIKEISKQDKEKIQEILKRVQINSSKWYIDTAKNLIVEWLTIDKFNKLLNIELADIYIKEKKYLNAEYIYKDLLEVLKWDIELSKKLWFVYALQNKLDESFEIYEKVHEKKKSDDEVIDFLSDLSFNIWNFEKWLMYSNLFLLSTPRNVDKMFIKAISLENLNRPAEAVLVYKRILELQPYNTQAKESLNLLEN